MIEVTQILAHGVSRPLIPIRTTFHGLLSRQKFHKSATKMIESIGLANVSMETDAQKLREDEDAIDPELTQFEIGISMSRYLPASGTAGFERILVKGKRRVPRPTTRMSAETEGRSSGCCMKSLSC